MTIIEAKMEQTTEGQYTQLFLDYLCFRDSNQIMIHTDCSRISGSFD